MRRHFPWLTLALLGLTTYLLAVLLSIWWQALGRPGWLFTWQHWAPWEPWGDAVVLHVGAAFLAWRWWVLIRALWERWGPW